ncbi:conjugal transfer protein TraG [Rhodocyclaceae bacterium]
MSQKQTQSLYSIPREQGDITRFVWSALAIMLMVTLLSMTASTQYIAWKFMYAQDLGGRIGHLGDNHLYLPFMCLVWIFKYYSPAYGQAVMQTISQGITILAAGGALSILIPVAINYLRTKAARNQRNDLHGSAHWADNEEIKKSGLLPENKNSGGVLLGQVEVDKKPVYLRHKGPEHILVFAPTRSGKGVGIVIPTLLSWDQSVLVHDIKGENWALTSGFREKALGQRCIRFAPSEPLSARFNPLREIRKDGNLVKDVQNIATIIVDPDGKGLNDHWAKTGFDLLTGVILYVLLSPHVEDDDRCLATVQGILSDGGVIRKHAEQHAQANASGGKEEDVPTGVQAVFEFIRDQAHKQAEEVDSAHEKIGWEAAGQAAQAYLNKSTNEASGVLSTALSFLALYRDPIVADNTRVSDFTIESLMQQKTSLYLVVPPSDKDRLKPLLRLVINQVVRRLTEHMEFDQTGQGKARYPHRLLLLIDEFPALGKLDVFEEALAFIAGYGLKALLIVQDLSQLQKAYTREESIISNCHIRIAYAPNKVETAKLLSEMTGTATVSHTQRNFSGKRLSILMDGVSTSEQIVPRPLLTADETMRLPASDELVFVAGHSPVYAQKIIYYADKRLAERQMMGAAANIGRGVS